MSLPTELRQWTTAQDGLDKLKLGTAPMPVPGKGEVLVKIHTVALNYRDTEVSCDIMWWPIESNYND